MITGKNVGIAPGATVRCIKVRHHHDGSHTYILNPIHTNTLLQIPDPPTMAQVLNDQGSGMLDHVVAGINMVGAEKRRTPGRAMVASLSLGAPAATVGGSVGRVEGFIVYCISFHY